MAILWMVPIYAVCSWLSLVFPKFEKLFGALRDFYEGNTNTNTNTNAHTNTNINTNINANTNTYTNYLY